MVNRRKEEDLADFVKRIREEKDLSQQDVENNCNGEISKGYVGQIETRVVLGTSITLGKLMALARGLGVPVEMVLDVARGKTAKDTQEFEESEFALMYSEVEKLTPQQKRDFKIAFDMAKDALRRIKE